VFTDTMYRNSNGLYTRNVLDFYKILLSNLPVFFDNKSMCEFITLFIKRHFYSIYMKMIEPDNKPDNINLNILYNIFEFNKFGKFNLLDRCIFITEDL